MVCIFLTAPFYCDISIIKMSKINNSQIKLFLIFKPINSGSRLMGSLWDNDKLIPIIDRFSQANQLQPSLGMKEFGTC